MEAPVLERMPVPDGPVDPSAWTDLGVTGTRRGWNKRQRQIVGMWLEYLRPGSLHHGMCVGVDEQTHRLARDIGGWHIVGHPPLDHSYLAAVECDEVWTEEEYLARNRTIVDVTERLLVVPRTMAEQRRSGTWATWRYANEVGRTIHLILPGPSRG